MVTLRQKVFLASRPFGLGDDTPRLASPEELPKFAAINCCPLSTPAEAEVFAGNPVCECGRWFGGQLGRGECWVGPRGGTAPAAGEDADLDERGCGDEVASDEGALLLFHRACDLLLWLLLLLLLWFVGWWWRLVLWLLL